MHYYVEQVLSALRHAQLDGTGGYLRVKPGADPEHVRKVLTEERDAAIKEVAERESAGRPGPAFAVEGSPAMQMLILTERLLAAPGEPVDIAAINEAQQRGRIPAIKRGLDEAVECLHLLFPRTFEVVAQL